MIRLDNLFDNTIYKTDLISLYNMDIILTKSKEENILYNYRLKKCHVKTRPILFKKTLDDRYVKELFTDKLIPVFETFDKDNNYKLNRIKSTSFVSLSKKNNGNFIFNYEKASKDDVSFYSRTSYLSKTYKKELDKMFIDSEKSYQKNLTKVKEQRPSILVK